MKVIADNFHPKYRIRKTITTIAPHPILWVIVWFIRPTFYDFKYTLKINDQFDAPLVSQRWYSHFFPYFLSIVYLDSPITYTDHTKKVWITQINVGIHKTQSSVIICWIGKASVKIWVLASRKLCKWKSKGWVLNNIKDLTISNIVHICDNHRWDLPVLHYHEIMVI